MASFRLSTILHILSMVSKLMATTENIASYKYKLD
jgi:hypothetical protein